MESETGVGVGWKRKCKSILVAGRACKCTHILGRQGYYALEYFFTLFFAIKDGTELGEMNCFP